jgi:hypothetical protein
MDTPSLDTLMRVAAFERVRSLNEIHDHLTATELKPGFLFREERIPLVNPQRGIFKPQQMGFLLSIKTVFPKPGGKVWYDDQREVHRQIFQGDETIDYAFMGKNPDAADNRWLKEAYENQIPIVYFLGIAPGRYQALLPTFISGWDGQALGARVTFGPNPETLTPPTDSLERRYALRAVKQRLHQATFREAVIAAYDGRCALSGLIDENRAPKGELQRGDRKSLQTDRVVLTLGPRDEINHVRRIYSMFVDDGLSEQEIATRLNGDGIPTDLGRLWTRSSVHQILTNEKYIGNNVFNRISFKLKQKRVVNSPDTWVRAEGVYPSIISQSLFERARTIIDARSNHYSDEQLLSLLQAILEEEGFLSGVVIDERADMPSSSAYRYRFGSLIRAYSLIGYAQQIIHSYATAID